VPGAPFAPVTPSNPPPIFPVTPSSPPHTPSISQFNLQMLS
ncbi:PREDICTED: serine/threonine-protein kinase WNK4-like, partial [Eurypyga helias]